jgi:hypothetical protein
MSCRTNKSSTCLHLLMHIFMVHGVDPLVEEAVVGYQHVNSKREENQVRSFWKEGNICWIM